MVQASASSHGRGVSTSTEASPQGMAPVPPSKASEAPLPAVVDAPEGPLAPPEPPQAEAKISLDALWQQVLAGLQLPSTRMLLSQQAHLRQLDDRRAVVRVASSWLTMVQSRLPLLEKAIQATLGGTRQITLEASDQERPDAAPGAGREPVSPLAVPPVAPVAEPPQIGRAHV